MTESVPGEMHPKGPGKGEQILEAGVQAVINLMADYEKTIEGLEIR